MSRFTASSVNYLRPGPILLKVHPELNERVQDLIAGDPSMLGLGDLVLRQKERIQPRAGRLDLLLQDPQTQRRSNFNSVRPTTVSACC
jgi:hypothetical protein